jgi:tRNA nucleotidyltransferase/poly(A) polymerase
MDKNGKIYDYHSGIEDLFSKNIRFIGDAKKRIEEDYLRILRYFRFAAAYGDYKCHPDYLQVISEIKSGVKILSSERIVSELLKIFSLPDSHKIVPPMMEVLDELFSLKVDSLDVCAKLGIFESLTNVERLSMLLKFSDFDETSRKNNFPKIIKEMIRLKADPFNSCHLSPFRHPEEQEQGRSRHGDVRIHNDNENGSLRRSAVNVSAPQDDEMKRELKKTKKKLRIFYAKFLAVDSYLNDGETAAKKLLKDLSDFCRSEYVDFELRAADLKEYDLTQEELKTVMIAAREFWTNNAASRDDCKKFAEERIRGG